MLRFAVPKCISHCRNNAWNVRGADKSLARPGRIETNVSVRMAWITFGALPCRKKTWWQLTSPCCWNRARPWHAPELVSFLVGLRTYQHPVRYPVNKCATNKSNLDLWTSLPKHVEVVWDLCTVYITSCALVGVLELTKSNITLNSVR